MNFGTEEITSHRSKDFGQVKWTIYLMTHLVKSIGLYQFLLLHNIFFNIIVLVDNCELCFSYLVNQCTSCKSLWWTPWWTRFSHH